jgi:hypothetical protein
LHRFIARRFDAVAGLLRGWTKSPSRCAVGEIANKAENANLGLLFIFGVACIKH